MPDRYGEPRPHRDPHTPDHTDTPDDNTPQTTPTPPNHAEAATRGMKLIRATMGWKTPQNPAQSQPDPKNTPP